jgi:hypothetical protein
MTLRRFSAFRLAPPALVALALSGGAQADVTATDVWSDLKSYLEDFGYEVAGTENQSGDTLTVSDATFTTELPDNEGSVRISASALTFTDTGAGEVTIGLPERMPIAVELTPQDGEPASFTLMTTQTAPQLTASGEVNDMTYAYSADALEMVAQDIVVDGEAMPPDSVDLRVKLSDLAQTTRMQVADLRSYSQEMSAGELTYNITFVVPEEDGGGDGTFSGRLNGLTLDGEGDIPLDPDATEVDQMLEAGLVFQGAFDYTEGSGNVALNSPEGPLVSSTSSNGGRIALSLGADGVEYDLVQRDFASNIEQMPQMPFPVSLAAAEIGTKVSVPLRASPEEQDFSLGLRVMDFTVSDTVWGLFDPAGQLPRDPATVEVDLTGKAKLDMNFTDPPATASASGEVPGQVTALTVNRLLVSAIGAQVTAAGAFTFDNSDLTTFAGMPRPEGAIDLRVEGANALIDKLVQMGLLPEEQAMGARMMIGLFGVPAGEDTLNSRIEINEQGHVLANGQRLQ